MLRSREEIAELRERVKAANQLLDKRESSTIYGKMKPLKKTEKHNDDHAIVPAKMAHSVAAAEGRPVATRAAEPRGPPKPRASKCLCISPHTMCSVAYL